MPSWFSPHLLASIASTSAHAQVDCLPDGAGGAASCMNGPVLGPVPILVFAMVAILLVGLGEVVRALALPRHG